VCISTRNKNKELKMARPGNAAKITFLMILAIALAVPVSAEQSKMQLSAKLKPATMNGATISAIATFTAKCESTLNMDVMFTPSWLASHVSAPHAQTENVNTVKLNLQGSSTVLPGYVECFYKSPGKDIYNLVYKFPCKSAKKQLIAGDVYSCNK
jgi:hypothetical protein